MNIEIIFGVLLFILTSAYSQRVIESKCSEYSRIPINSSNPLSHIAMWSSERIMPIGSIIRVVEQVIYVIMISDKFLLGNYMGRANPGLDNISKNLQNQKIIFSSNYQQNVIKILYQSLNIESTQNIVLLKINRIVLNSNFRPACLWARNEYLTGTVNFIENKFILRDVTDDASTDFYAKVLETTSTNALYDAIVCPNLSITRTFCFKIDNTKNDFTTWNPYTPILQNFKPLNFLPKNYYVYGMLTSLIPDKHTAYNLAISSLFDWIEVNVWEADVTSCGIATTYFNPVLINAEPTLVDEFPWHAALFYIEAIGKREYKCGGTLLNENTVVTAAHCVTTPTGTVSHDVLVVILGKHNLNFNSLESRETSVTRIIVHQTYNRHTYANDIALLKLRTMMVFSQYIKPICITKNLLLFENPIGVVPGWGKNEFNQLEVFLTKASFPIHPQSECYGEGPNLTNLAGLVSENTICAGYQNGTSLCNGDSGGGLIFNVSNKWFIRGIASVGITSSESGECDPFELNLFTDVSKFYDWIVDRM